MKLLVRLANPAVARAILVVITLMLFVLAAGAPDSIGLP